MPCRVRRSLGCPVKSGIWGPLSGGIWSPLSGQEFGVPCQVRSLGSPVGSGGIWGPLSGQELGVPCQLRSLGPPVRSGGVWGLLWGQEEFGVPFQVRGCRSLSTPLARLALPGAEERWQDFVIFDLKKSLAAGDSSWMCGSVRLPRGRECSCRDGTAAFLADKAPDRLIPAPRASGTAEISEIPWT